MRYILFLLSILSAAVVGAQVAPQLQLQASGSCRQLLVRDPQANSTIPLFCLDGTTKATIPTGVKILTPAITGGTVSGATITSPTVSGGSFSAPSISAATIGGSALTSPTITGGTMANTAISGGTLTGATISGASTISGSTISSSTFSGGTVSGATITSPTVSGGSFSASSISGATIAGSTLNSPTINTPTITSPTLAGTAVAPTPAVDDATTKVATTAYVQTALGNYLTPKMFGAVPNDGVDDSAAFNTMIATASSTGRAILIPSGTYDFSGSIMLRSNVTMIGMGNAVLRAMSTLPQTGGLMQVASYTAGTDAYAQQHITLRGLVFDGNSGARTLTQWFFLVSIYSTDDITVADCVFRNHQFGLLGFGGSRNITLSNDHFSNWGRPAVSSEGGPALWLAGNSIGGDNTPTRAVRAYGLDFRDSEWAAIYVFARDVVLSGGTIYNTKEGGIYGSGLTQGTYIWLPKDVTQRVEITGYNISKVVRKYIQAAGIEIGGVDLRIHDNTIYDTQNSGIEINWPSQNVIIADNMVYDTVKDTAGYANFASSGQINLLQQSAAIDPSNYMRDITISGNRIGKRGLTPIAGYAVSLLTLDASSYMESISVLHNDIQFGFATSPYKRQNTPLLAADPHSRFVGNVGGPDERAFVKYYLMGGLGNTEFDMGFPPQTCRFNATVADTGSADTATGIWTRGADIFTSVKQATMGVHSKAASGLSRAYTTGGPVIVLKNDAGDDAYSVVAYPTVTGIGLQVFVDTMPSPWVMIDCQP